MNYPNGKPFKQSQTQDGSTRTNKSSKIKYGGRGMTLENDIESSNRYYLKTERAVIHKKPTPVQIVHVDYPKRSQAVIKEAYFRTPSTTDYNGVYKGYYIDFEAKETKNKTSFPLQNIHAHQVEHMKQAVAHGGIVFLLLRFKGINEVYLLPFKRFFPFWERYLKNGKKSIKVEEIQENGYYIPYQYQPRLDYLNAVDKLILDESEDRL
ncbi:TPA: Holliday junction resolvase RecU [Staphylococcus pseudintermedius]|uniref:Holliday junction resolvase RecU n=1 Tax=Staphylococcus pseudintermedius TaxID=283734 RepID=A0A317ZAW3_STAPS|nr:Holliday junction resolvase RecU [Staphylococcus pseudintermedius]ANQ88352.1 Holliday junction resolvase RecU [Staphylococcus pseudintermedius]AYG56658.1 Holliday junction resolvase RecU [Staphylococcus pseudintermedius]EGQ0365957.1 Holliday junction resolvase RecU [Staphylococcus pseudintermedius]EGQ2703978.1 Holliday junction resolvase RecU [Staphylococcus pseudintermedius]EGQ2805984.1 Holliday junction resolvase RecU [Staphylococcus pseudintermedius]